MASREAALREVSRDATGPSPPICLLLSALHIPVSVHSHLGKRPFSLCALSRAAVRPLCFWPHRRVSQYYHPLEDKSRWKLKRNRTFIFIVPYPTTLFSWPESYSSSLYSNVNFLRYFKILHWSVCLSVFLSTLGEVKGQLTDMDSLLGTKLTSSGLVVSACTNWATFPDPRTTLSIAECFNPLTGLPCSWIIA